MAPVTSSAPPASGAVRQHKSKAGSKPGLVRAVMENIEALAIAIVMALVLKYFLIEAYKIPTGSMQPAIMGDQVPGIFDRVLVNKLVYMLRDPKPYEVVVFKNPLWQRQNYIKRLIGFENERIELRNGDIFVTPPGGTPAGETGETIRRKPDEVWRAVRKNLISEADGKRDLASRFEAASGDARDPVTIQGDRIIFAGPGSASIRTREPIRDGYLDGYDRKWIESYQHPSTPFDPQASWARSKANGKESVGDVEIAADVTPGKEASRIAFEIRESGRVHRIVLPVASGAGSLATSTAETTGAIVDLAAETAAAAARLPALRRGVTTRVSFRNVDDSLVVELDDDVALRLDYRTRGVDPIDPKSHAPFETEVAIEATGSFALTDVGLWRDIHYLPDGEYSGVKSATYTVPPGEYMVLGDNTQNSWDCRQWKMATYTLTDGTKIPGNYFSASFESNSSMPVNPDSNPWSRGAEIHFRNIYGQDYVFTRDQVDGDPTDPEIRAVHSFPKEFLLGKALAVFWPLPPFAPTWRLKWVR